MLAGSKHSYRWPEFVLAYRYRVIRQNERNCLSSSCGTGYAWRKMYFIVRSLKSHSYTTNNACHENPAEDLSSDTLPMDSEGLPMMTRRAKSTASRNKATFSRYFNVM